MKISEIQEMMLETSESIWVVRNEKGGWSVMCNDRPLPSSRSAAKRWATLDAVLAWLAERVEFSFELFATVDGLRSGRIRLVEVV